MITFPASWVFVRLELSTAEFILTSAGPVLRVRGGVEGSVRFQGRLPLRAASSFKDLIRTGVSTDPQVQRSNRMHKFIIVRVAAGLSLSLDSVTEFLWRVPLVRADTTNLHSLVKVILDRGIFFFSPFDLPGDHSTVNS